MRNIGRMVKGSLCTAAVAAGMLSLSGCTNYSKMLKEDTRGYIAMASENTTNAMVKSTFAEEFAILGSAIEEGTVGLGFKAEDIVFNGDFYVNEKKAESSQLYSFENEGQKAEIYFAANTNEMKFGTSGNSGSYTYSLPFDTLKDDLAASIFAPDSGSEYALDSEEYDMFIEYAEQLGSVMAGEETSSSYEEYEKLVEDLLAANQPEIAEKTEIEVAGETVSANVITYKFDKEDITAFASSCFDAALKNASEDEAASTEELKTEFMSALEQAESINLELVYSINSKTHTLMQFDMSVNVTVEGDTADVLFNMVYGADPASAKTQTFTATVKADEEEYALIVTAENGDNSTKFNFDVSGVSGGMNFTTNFMTIDCTRENENYTITVNVPVVSVDGTVTGTVKGDSKSFELTVDNIAFTSESSELNYAPEGRFSVKKGGEYLDRDVSKKFLEITEDEFSQLGTNIGNDFGAVFDVDNEDYGVSEYVEVSEQSAANANAKIVYTALSAQLTQMAISGETFSGYAVENNGTVFTIGDTEADLYDYLGDSFTGYCYAEVDSEDYCVNFALWSEEPISDDYKYQLSEYLMSYAASDGSVIGCYPPLDVE